MVSGAVSARCRATQPSSPASDPCPVHSTSPAVVSSSSSAGGVAGHPGRQHQRLQRGGRDHRAGQLLDRPQQRRRCRATPDRASTPMPFQAGRNRANACFSTGSTSARSAASDRRRSSRSTSASTNSGADSPDPVHRRAATDRTTGRAGRNSPSASRPVADQPAQRVGDHGDAEPEPGRRLGRDERAVGAGVPAEQPTERIVDRLQQRLGDPRRQRRYPARPAASARRSGRPTAPRRRSAPR